MKVECTLGSTRLSTIAEFVQLWRLLSRFSFIAMRQLSLPLFRHCAKPQNVSENALCTNSDITLSNTTQLPKVSNAINSIQTAGLVTVKQIIVLILKQVKGYN